MSGIDVTLDPKSLQNVLKRLQKIERVLNPAPRTPLGDLVKITALDIATNAKKRTPVITGRLRSSIHPKFKPTETFIYSDNEGKTYTDSLKEPIEEGKEAVVGTNVDYAFKIENSRGFLYGGVKDSEPKLKRRLESLAKQVVGGKPNITIT